MSCTYLSIARDEAGWICRALTRFEMLLLVQAPSAAIMIAEEEVAATDKDAALTIALASEHNGKVIIFLS